MNRFKVTSEGNCFWVSPKHTVLDPQGAAVEHAMKSLGHESVEGVRVGKDNHFRMDGSDSQESRKNWINYVTGY